MTAHLSFWEAQTVSQLMVVLYFSLDHRHITALIIGLLVCCNQHLSLKIKADCFLVCSIS